MRDERAEDLDGWILGVDEEGAVHLPAPVMRALGIEPGDPVEWLISGDGLELRRGRP
ncbi:MAG: AbrB/MazE/SpoVT family DNA-binding domain-containing protein [Kyrpidia sp.]|nr:AbrB/MazE/SpoVT family DNA-binding domain-containing protein [Kyrpidia sp.]